MAREPEGRLQVCLRRASGRDRKSSPFSNRNKGAGPGGGGYAIPAPWGTPLANEEILAEMASSSAA